MTGSRDWIFLMYENLLSMVSMVGAGKDVHVQEWPFLVLVHSNWYMRNSNLLSHQLPSDHQFLDQEWSKSWYMNTKKFFRKITGRHGSSESELAMGEKVSDISIHVMLHYLYKEERSHWHVGLIKFSAFYVCIFSSHLQFFRSLSLQLVGCKWRVLGLGLGLSWISNDEFNCCTDRWVYLKATEK